MDKEIQNTNNKYFKSDDILYISFALTRGIKLIDIVEDFPNHFIFLLSDPNQCQEQKQEFLNNSHAPARDLFANREMLITEIKRKQKNGEIYGKNKFNS